MKNKTNNKKCSVLVDSTLAKDNKQLKKELKKFEELNKPTKSKTLEEIWEECQYEPNPLEDIYTQFPIASLLQRLIFLTGFVMLFAGPYPWWYALLGIVVNGMIFKTYYNMRTNKFIKSTRV